MSWPTMQNDEQVNRAAAWPCACPRQYFSLAPAHTSRLLVALCLALACGPSDRPSIPSLPEDQDIFAWVFGQDLRVTRTGGSEVILLLSEPDRANPAESSTQVLAACGDIDDILPSHPGTHEYFFVVNGELWMGPLGKNAPRTRITIRPAIRISRLLLLEKSSPGRVLLVEAVPQKGEQRGNLWRLSITGNNATARREPDRRVPEYQRDFHNARCAQGDNRCLHIGVDSQGTPTLDIEPRPKASRRQYRRLSDLPKLPNLLLRRAVFHPKTSGAVLLTASCK